MHVPTTDIWLSPDAIDRRFYVQAAPRARRPDAAAQSIVDSIYIATGSRRLGGQVEAVVVVGPEGRVALGALALARLVARAQAVPAEHVEALRQYGVFALHLRNGTLR